MTSKLGPRVEEHRLYSLLEKGLQRAQLRRRPVLVSIVVPVPMCDPLALFDRSTAVADDRLLWMRPGDGYAMVGIGAAWTLSVGGASRFADAAASWRNVISDALTDAPVSTIGTGPVLIGGFSFDPLRSATSLWDRYPDGLLVLPRYLLTSVGGSAWLTFNTVLRPVSDLQAEFEAITGVSSLLLAREAAERSSSLDDGVLTVEDVVSATEWKATVQSLTREMQGGDLEKVVLARECRARSKGTFDPALILRRLRADYPSCYLFAVARGDHCFLGASPEQLVHLHDGEMRAMCLAGSAARGATDEEDQRFGEALLASAKERAEHAVVVRALRDALGKACTEVLPSGPPALLKVQHIQHLLTTVVGSVADGCAVLDLVERLHPTPAVGGYPREIALRLIREREGVDRGWYAGPIGWLDARGEGEFAVAIRSTLLRGPEASLFAGCGLVAASDPESEYAESCLKLKPILSALEGAQ